MTRTPFTLAALASAAVPGLDARSIEPRPSTDDHELAVVRDSEGKPYLVRAPRTATASASMEAELSLLAALGPHQAAGELSFEVPSVLGTVLLPEGGHAVVHPLMGGTALNLESLTPGPGLARDIGTVIASIHELPSQVIEDAGLPVYTAEEHRERRLVEVDEAAATGKVPFTLLRRWEEALEDITLWRFGPVLVHGDLGPEQVRVRGRHVVEVTDWGQAHVADPADDLAWLVVAAPPDAVESVLEGYRARRSDPVDPHLVRRAQLVGELALARWLLYGVRSGRAEVVADAQAMLEDLAMA